MEELKMESAVMDSPTFPFSHVFIYFNLPI